MRGMRIVFAKSESCLELLWARVDFVSARFRLTKPLVAKLSTLTTSRLARSDRLLITLYIDDTGLLV